MSQIKESQTESPSRQDQDIQQLKTLIKNIPIAMMTTISSDGHARSRPMASQGIDARGDLWFFTGRSTDKVEAIHDHHLVHLIYAEPKDSKYVSIDGIAEVVDDRQKARELWNPLYKAWFPNGVDDPELILIRVRIESAEYWASPSGKAVQIMGFMKAMATGKSDQKPRDLV